MADSISTEIAGSFAANLSGAKKMSAEFRTVVQVIQDTSRETEKLGALLRTATHTAEINKAVAAMHALQRETIDAAAATRKLEEEKKRVDQAGEKLAAYGDLAKNVALSAAKKVGEFFKDTLVEGVRFNAMLETTQLSLAAMLKANNPEHYKTFDQALQRSANILDQLKQKALQSPATFEQLVQTFQGSAGAMAAAGVPMQKQVELVTQLSAAMAGMGISSQEMRQETEALLSGKLKENARLADVLHITDEEITRAREQGGLFELITGKLNSMGTAGKTGAESIAQLESKLQSTYRQVAADNTADLTSAYRDLLTALTALVESDVFAGFVRMLSMLTKGALETAQGIADAIRGDDTSTRKARAAANDSASVTSRAEAVAQSKKNRALLDSIEKEIKELEAKSAMTFDAGPIYSMLLGTLAGPTMKQVQLMQLRSARKKLLTANTSIDIDDPQVAAKLDARADQEQQEAAAAKARAESERRRREANKNASKETAAPPASPQTSPPASPTRDLEAERVRLEAERRKLDDEKRKDADEARNLSEQFSLRQRRFETSIAAIRANPYITQKEKNELLNGEFRDERDSLTGRLALAEDMAIGETEGSNRQGAYLTEARRLKERQETIGNDIDATDATTVFKDYEQGIAKLQSSFKSLGQSLADGVGSTMSSLSDHLGKLIMGTETWGQALNGVWKTFSASMLRAFTDMVAQWAIKKAAMFAIDALFSMKSLALSAANAAKNLVLWIPSAIAASISSFGTAAAIGAAAVIAALAIKGFSEGGYTGDGSRLDPAGIVHRGEVVFSQADIARHGGVAAVEALRISGGITAIGAGVTASPSAGGAGGPALGAGQAPVNIAYFNTRQDAETWLVSQRGTRVLKDWMRENRYDT